MKILANVKNIFTSCHFLSYQKFRFHTNLRKMSSTTSMIAVCQLNCTSDREKNFETCARLINVSASHKAKMVFLPECFDYVGESMKQSMELAEPLDGPLMTKLCNLAKTNGLWLSLGGFHEKNASVDEKRVFNSHVLINSNGEIVSIYRKIHLFDIDIPGTMQLRESEFTVPGNEVIPPVSTPVGLIGLGICYDLRFPEFSLCLRKSGAEILTYPSAFTVATGMAHWETLLRARAIETQTYVIAAAQVGKHNPKRSSYGHSMVVDPWGCIIACCSEGEGVIFAEIDRERIQKTRTNMPVMAHRRENLYALAKCNTESDIFDQKFMFGEIVLNPDFIFYKTQYSMAFVNIKCVLPGHVLVTPLRCAKQFSHLLPGEVADLFCCVQRVQKVIMDVHNASSSSIAIQDGPDAGQTVPHVHIHILPRKPNDFEKNDDIYTELFKHDKNSSGRRTTEEMVKEARSLKEHF